MIIIGLAVWYLQPAAMVIFCGFAASGLLKLFYVKFIHKKSDYQITAEQLKLDAVNAREDNPEIDDIE
jgi:hypothetical protein